MELKQRFSVQHDVETVWKALSDAPFAVQCLPGATLEPSDDNVNYKGKMKVKLGPLSAAFAGDAVVERDESTKTGTVNWTGVDTRSNSRTKATMVYRVLPEEKERCATVDITADVALTGALAQFGRGGIIQDVANRLTAIFADNLQHRLNESANPSPAAEGGSVNAGDSHSAPIKERKTKSQELQALPLLWSLLRGRLASGLRRIANWVDGRQT